MPAIEIVGVLLAAFPLVVNCLEHYRKGFEPLEEWWNFRTHFIVFIDDIRHQMMRYRANMMRLLHPIIADNDSFTALVQNAKEPRWTDGSLDALLEIRLASEYTRFLKIINRMEEVVESLKKLLQIKDSDVDWIGSNQRRPWEWHLKRVQISFAKGKYKKVKKLAIHNQELQEILDCSERMIPIVDTRKSSEPVALFEKIHQHACGVHSALKLYWNCSGERCRPHQAHLRLRAEIKSMSLNVLFVLEGERESCSKPLKKEVMIQPAEYDLAVPLTSATQTGDVQQGASFARIQEQFEKITIKDKKWSSSRPFSKLSEPRSSSNSEQANLVTPSPKTISPPVTIIGSSKLPCHLIKDLCWSLRNCQEPSFGVIADEHDRQFQLCRLPEPGPAITAPDTAGLVSLRDVLEANHEESIDIARQCRFEMAAHIASALLQIQTSPWLSTRWSKHDFYFLADSHALYSNYPYVSQSFDPRFEDSLTLTTNTPVCEEDTRTALFTVGVIILELIFGHNIESCDFRPRYYGANNQANDLTNMCTARKWAKKVLGECGPDIDDVVRRCLDCSFGPRPNFQDPRFREAVYEGVIKPLAEHLKIWQPLVP